MANGIDPNILLGIRAPNVQRATQGVDFGRIGANIGKGISNIRGAEEKEEAEDFKELTAIVSSGDFEGAKAFLDQSRIDPEDRPAIIAAFQNPEQLKELARRADEVLGIESGAQQQVDPIEQEKLVIRREELAEKQRSAEEKAAISREKLVFNRTSKQNEAEFKRRELTEKFRIAELSGDKKLESQARQETQKINIKRIAELSQAALQRGEAVKKAQQFRRALSTGEATSGTTRTFASFIPGVFTDQAAFDQKFNAFAEVAARQALKSAGELRPTDADVEGMKRAMFGVGRDEAVNIQLLDEFIAAQQNLDIELEDLKEAKAQNRLNVFTGQDPVVPTTGTAGFKFLGFE